MPRRANINSRREVLDSLFLHKELLWRDLLDYAGISKGALSYTLKDLIEEGSVSTRADESRRPPRTLYSLSPLGNNHVFTGALARILGRYSKYEDENYPFTNLKLYSEPDLTEFLSEDSKREIALTQRKAQQSIFNTIEECVKQDFQHFFERKNYSKEEIELIEYCSVNKSWFRDLKERRKDSGVVSTPQENEEVLRKELEKALIQGFESVDEYKNAYGPRSPTTFHRMMKKLPLTFAEDEEYEENRRRFEVGIPLYDHYGDELAKAIPKLCLLMYNWQFEEELLLSSPILVRAGPEGEVKPIIHALASLSREELETYYESVVSFLDDPGYSGPVWPGPGKDRPRLPQLGYRDLNARRNWGEKILVKIEEMLKTQSSENT